MAEILLGALSMAFFLVRIIKGPWMRNPQYVAAATVGAMAVSLGLFVIAPDLEFNIIVGSLVGGAGAFAGIFAFDVIRQN